MTRRHIDVDQTSGLLLSDSSSRATSGDKDHVDGTWTAFKKWVRWKLETSERLKQINIGARKTITTV